MLDQPDPVGAWRSLIDRHARLIERLSGVRELRVVSAGTDLRVHVDGRAWESCAGEANLPDGEVFCSPPLDGVEGEITFDVPSRDDGRECRDVRLRFEAGVVIDASASFGEDVLLARLDTDEGARRAGEFAIGTNEMITRAVGETLRREDRRHVPSCARPLVSQWAAGRIPRRSTGTWSATSAPAGASRPTASPCWWTGSWSPDGSLRRPLRARDRGARPRGARGPDRARRGRGGRPSRWPVRCFRRVLEAGGHPTVQMLPDGLIETKAESASDEVLAEADPLKLTWYKSGSTAA